MTALNRLTLALGSVALASCLLASPAAAQPSLPRLPRVVARIFAHVPPPPPPLREVLPARPPGPPRVWIPGHYAWNGRAYHWTGGRWVRPPRPGLRWLPGRWHHNRRGWFWTNGHWR